VQVKLHVRYRGETTKESKKGKYEAEGIPYQRADICVSNKPLLDYRAFISERVYRRFKDKNSENIRTLEGGLDPRIISEDHGERLKIDPELMNRINNEEYKVNLRNKPEYTVSDNDASSKFKIKKLYP
jgi:hypothetical protein